ncbi:hypothetical protein PFISCL1PPCAC_3654, partial [Pristionchus fissidentatus]
AVPAKNRMQTKKRSRQIKQDSVTVPTAASADPSPLSPFLFPHSSSPSPSFSQQSIESEPGSTTRKRSKCDSLAATVSKISAMAAHRDSPPLLSTLLALPSMDGDFAVAKIESLNDSSTLSEWDRSQLGVMEGGGEGSVACTICGKKFSSDDSERQKVRYHVLFHVHDASPASSQYRCSVCNISHFEQGKVKRHLIQLHKETVNPEALIVDCKNELMSAKWALMIRRCFPQYDFGKLEIGKLWRVQTSLEEKLDCAKCGEQVPSSHLLLHIADCHEFDRLFHCTQCTEIFVSETARSAHSLQSHGMEMEEQPKKILFHEKRDDDIKKAFFPGAF